MTTPDTSPQAVAELCERIADESDAAKYQELAPDPSHALRQAAQALRALASDLQAARDTIRKLHDDRSIANQQLAACREGLDRHPHHPGPRRRDGGGEEQC